MAYGLRTALFTIIGAGILAALLPRPLVSSFIRRLQTVYRLLAEEAGRRPKVVLLLIWIVALIPMVQMSATVRHYSVNVPTLDDWAMAPLIVKAHTGELKWAHVFHQQQEARTVLPNLIFLLSARTEWNVRDQMWVSLVSSWLMAAGLFVLLRRSGLKLGAIAICFWLMVLAVFSPAAYELWIFASGFPSFLPGLFLVTALVVAGARCRMPWKFAGCAVLAAAGTFTLAHGILVWAFSLPVMLIVERPPRWRQWLSLWLGLGALCAVLYFWDYQKPSPLPRFAPPIALLEYVSFFLQFLGGGLAYALNDQPSTAAILFGLFQLVMLVVALIYTVRRINDPGFTTRVVPWFALAFYALASAGVATLGRVDYGAAYALASRYVPFSLCLTLPVIALLAIVLAALAKSGHTTPARRWPVIAAVVLVAVYFVPYKAAAGNTLYYLRSLSASHRLARGALLFSGVIDTTAVIQKRMFPPAPDHVVRNAGSLNDLKLLRPPLARTNELKTLPHESADGKRVAGACETIVTTGDSYRASGWALLRAKKRPADCIVISVESPGAEPVLYAISDSIEMRWDVARPSWPNDYLWSGWSATFPRATIPPGAKLAFWAVDADEPRLYRLDEPPAAPAP